VVRAQPERQGQTEQHRGRAGEHLQGQARVAVQPLARPLAQRRLARVLERQAVELALEVFLELARAAVAAGRIGLQAAADDGIGRGRDGLVEPAGGRGRPAAVADHLRQHLGRARQVAGAGGDVPGRHLGPGEGARGEGRLPGEQLVKEHAQREEVAPGIDAAPPAAQGLQLLGGHVRQGAPDQRFGGAGALGVLRQVEIQQHRLALVREQDVGRLEVVVHDPAFVGVGEPVRQAAAQPQDGFPVAQPLQVARNHGGRPG
jgi:hypothetical protein